MKSRKNIFKLTRSQWISVAVLASSLGLAIAVTIPNTFTAGTNISATQMNDNFAAIATAINTSSLSAATSATAPAALSAAAAEMIGIDFTCPADGFVIAQGHTVVDVSHVNGISDNVFVKVSATVETNAGGLGWTQTIVPSAFPTSANFRIPTSVSSRLACAGGVAARYRLNASSTSAAANALFHVLVLNYSPS